MNEEPGAGTIETEGQKPGVWQAPRPLVIIGPTASGKSSLAIEVAARNTEAGTPVEIVSVDAMAVYREMEIGTAAPSMAERRGVPHHLIGVADPSEDYTVSRFQSECQAAISDIESRGAVPLLVGGTGLYVQAVVDDLDIPGQFPEIRDELDARPESGTLSMWAELRALDPIAAAKMEPNNRRRVVRALEVCLGSGLPFSSFGPGMDAFPPSRFQIIGLQIDRTFMDARIDLRYEQQMAAGFLDEVQRLLDRPDGLSRNARQGLGYRELIAHIEGSSTLDEALDEARRRTRRFARRQQRWFGRDTRIHWIPVDADQPALTEAVVAEVQNRWLRL